MPFKKGESGNPNGRPKGRFNKVKADVEIARALAAGSSMEDLVVMLSDRINSKEVSDTQRGKFITQLIDLKKYLMDRELKLVGAKGSAEKAEAKKNADQEKKLKEIRENRPVVAQFSPKAIQK